MHSAAQYESAPEPPDPDEVRYLIAGARVVIGLLTQAGGEDSERHVVMLESHLRRLGASLDRQDFAGRAMAAAMAAAEQRGFERGARARVPRPRRQGTVALWPVAVPRG